MDSPWWVFLVFLRLGCTSFGGPVAHLGYFRQEFVQRRGWLSEQSYADLMALCQFLPGPLSSQLGLAVGFSRAGYGGALAAWLGFTLPSALIMIGLAGHSWLAAPGLVHGLKVAAVAIVAQAVLAMAKNLCPDWPRRLLALAVAAWMLAWPSDLAQLLVMAAGATVGSLCLRPALRPGHQPLPLRASRKAGLLWLSLFGLLLALSFLADPRVAALFRVGSLVFGGGHVVLPLLQGAVVEPGWVSRETFLAGYGAAQALPGPLFSFAGFLGASMTWPVGPWQGGWICVAAIFAPSFLLVFGSLPFWEDLRRLERARAALAGVNAAVVGLLLAAFVYPVCSSALLAAGDLILALLGLAALLRQVPSWAVVLGCSLVSLVLYR